MNNYRNKQSNFGIRVSKEKKNKKTMIPKEEQSQLKHSCNSWQCLLKDQNPSEDKKIVIYDILFSIKFIYKCVMQSNEIFYENSLCHHQHCIIHSSKK